MNQTKATPGRIVHYVLPDGAYKGAHRAAIVTSDFGGTTANLTVFLDQTADHSQAVSNNFVLRAWSAPFDPEGKPGTWHWPEQVMRCD